MKLDPFFLLLWARAAFIRRLSLFWRTLLGKSLAFVFLKNVWQSPHSSWRVLIIDTCIFIRAPYWTKSVQRLVLALALRRIAIPHRGLRGIAILIAVLFSCLYFECKFVFLLLFLFLMQLFARSRWFLATFLFRWLILSHWLVLSFNLVVPWLFRRTFLILTTYFYKSSLLGLTSHLGLFLEAQELRLSSLDSVLVLRNFLCHADDFLLRWFLYL